MGEEYSIEEADDPADESYDRQNQRSLKNNTFLIHKNPLEAYQHFYQYIPILGLTEQWESDIVKIVNPSKTLGFERRKRDEAVHERQIWSQGID